MILTIQNYLPPLVSMELALDIPKLVLGMGTRIWLPNPMLTCTVGVDFKVKTVVLDGKRVKLSIWVSRTRGHTALHHCINV